MPLNRCESDGKPGWKWGDSGKCYLYTSGNEESEMAARKQAMAQAAAMGEFAGTGNRSADDGSGSSLDTQYRSFTPDLEVRSGGDGRTVHGIAVPYNAPVRVESQGIIERIARGAFNHQLRAPSRVKFAREHVLLGGELIGAATLLRDDAAGLYVELRAARTPKGDETLELIKDQALDQLSVAFRERQNRSLGRGIVERVKAHLFEIAATMEGVYGEMASIAGVRSKQIPQAAIDLDLRMQADEYLRGLPQLSDHELEIRRIRLGL